MTLTLGIKQNDLGINVTVCFSALDGERLGLGSYRVIKKIVGINPKNNEYNAWKL